MNRSMLNAVRALSSWSGSLPVAIAGMAGLLAAGPAPALAQTTSVSPIVLEHLIAQAGFTVGFGWNQFAQYFALSLASSNTSCAVTFGGNAYGVAVVSGTGVYQSELVGLYYDGGCRKPYLTDSILTAPGPGGSALLVHDAQFEAPNGAILGALSLAEEQLTSIATINGKATYKAVAGVGQAPVRTGFACQQPNPATSTFNCQAGTTQDFPALKLALGSIVHFTLTATQTSSIIYTVLVTGTTAKLVTGKLGGLAIAATSATSLGFQGQHTVVATGSTSGSSPLFSVIPASGTHWTFNDAQQGIKFSIATAAGSNSSGEVVTGKTNATAKFQVDESGTGAITYSDKSKAKITNWTLSD